MNKPIARSSDIVVQEVGEETLIYDLKTNEAKCLNETSAAVWELCDGKRTSVEIAVSLSARFKTEVDHEFVLLAFDQLAKEDLLEDQYQEVVFKGTSRREVIKKVGFASVVALPIVSSVVAPSAAHAQSVFSCSGQPGDPANCACQLPQGGPEDRCCWGACDAYKQTSCDAVRPTVLANCAPMYHWTTPGGCHFDDLSCEAQPNWCVDPNIECCSNEKLTDNLNSALASSPIECDKLHMFCTQVTPPGSRNPASCQ